MMEMMKLKKAGDKSDNVRSRSKSRERVSLLGTSNNNNQSTNGNRLRGREVRRRTMTDSDDDDGKEERVSLLTNAGGAPGAGKSKRNSRRKSSFDNLLNKNNKPPWTMTRLMKYAALLLVSASMSFLLLRKESKVIHWEEYHNILQPDGSKETRCFEESRSSRDERCSCPDPNKALANDDKTKALWKSNHDHMIHQAKNAPKDLDIVFFGDGMIEQLSGTRGLGAENVEGMEEYFERQFTNNKNGGGGKFNAIALGSSGDTVRIGFVFVFRRRRQRRQRR